MSQKNQKRSRLGIICLVGLGTSAAVSTFSRSASTQTMPELSVGLRGRVRVSERFGTEQVATVDLSYAPPERSAVAITGAALAEVEPDLETAPGSEVPLDPAERDDPIATSDALRAPHRDHDGPIKQQDLPRDVPYVLTPAYVREAVGAALRSQGIAAALGRLDGLSSRAKTSAMLPEARFRAGRDVDQSLRLTPTTDDPYRYSQSGGISFVIEGAVTWRLGRLVFASEELGIERLRLAQARERQRVSAAAMNELLAWQTAWRRVAAAGDRRSNATEELVESTLRLDVLTGGWFSAHQPALDPSEMVKSPATTPPRPASAPAPAEGGAPGVVPRVRRPRQLPRQASQTEDLAAPATSSARQQLERLALSR